MWILAGSWEGSPAWVSQDEPRGSGKSLDQKWLSGGGGSGGWASAQLQAVESPVYFRAQGQAVEGSRGQEVRTQSDHIGSPRRCHMNSWAAGSKGLQGPLMYRVNLPESRTIPGTLRWDERTSWSLNWWDKVSVTLGGWEQKHRNEDEIFKKSILAHPNMCIEILTCSKADSVRAICM